MADDFQASSFYGDDNEGDLRGPKGAQGDQGPQGDPGPRGEPGAPGRDGEDGKSAYDLWVAAGNIGEYDSFLQAQQGPAGKSAAYRFAGFAVQGIQPSEILMDHEIATACTIGAGFAGCVAGCTVPPAAPWVAAILRNDSPVGTLTIDVAGVATFSASAAIALLSGDTMSLVAPEGADEEIARVRVTFVAELPDLIPSNPGSIG
ncbi:hypothetical protein SR41_04605 [Sphingomonas melonis]|uniref:Collagen triple helix repeat protein n=1 Tax=Sphingomonas melonis TaxID=152682 RepID=A0A0D1KYA2_9SPHN|nr:collagen-like protein [Sphingomonas melonis]KIU29294.1 hypothetical protein SR41_04605 [Sphingomonas melonis]